MIDKRTFLDGPLNVDVRGEAIKYMPPAPKAYATMTNPELLHEIGLLEWQLDQLEWEVSWYAKYYGQPAKDNTNDD